MYSRGYKSYIVIEVMCVEGRGVGGGEVKEGLASTPHTQPCTFLSPSSGALSNRIPCAPSYCLLIVLSRSKKPNKSRLQTKRYVLFV